jgi:hypothetical protein
VPTSSDVGKTQVSGSSIGGAAGSPARTYVLVGEAALTLGALAVGVGFTLQAASEDETAESARTKLADKMSACSAPGSSPELPAICADLAAAADRASHDRLAARLGFVGAGVGAAAFVATFLLWPSKRPQAAIVHPWIGPGARGLSLEGRF